MAEQRAERNVSLKAAFTLLSKRTIGSDSPRTMLEGKAAKCQILNGLARLQTYFHIGTTKTKECFVELSEKHKAAYQKQMGALFRWSE
ncbi:MAG: hypothetical protein Q9181_002370 [Wetmoreana brouardii]